jgi:hypothetical protein
MVIMALTQEEYRRLQAYRARNHPGYKASYEPQTNAYRGFHYNKSVHHMSDRDAWVETERQLNKLAVDFKNTNPVYSHSFKRAAEFAQRMYS